MKIIIYTENEIVNVVMPSPSFLEDHTLEEVAAGAVPNGIDYLIVEEEFLPTEMEFRNAWKLNGNIIDIDIIKAREITRERLRYEREPLLQKLDIDMMKNWNNQMTMIEVETEKQRLRDITLLVDNVNSIEELRKIRCI